MTRLALLIAVAPLALAACAPEAPVQRTALECPTTQGELTRRASSATECTYASRSGATVTLRLTPVAGSLDQTLDGIEKALVAEAAPAAAPAAEAATPEPSAATDAAKAAAAASTDAAAAAGGAGEGVNVRIGAKGVEVQETGSSKTRVNLPGISIEADEASDSAKVNIGPIHVDASDDEATVRIRRDVKLRGEGLAREKRGVRATFISQTKNAGGEKRVVGYEAGGPKAGPITVAVIRGQGGYNSGDALYDAVRRLVERNGGV